jgi:glucosamine kinase
MNSMHSKNDTQQRAGDLVIGVDGGGTKTQAAVAARDGRILGQGWGGPSNYHDVGEDAARANLAQAVEAARRAAGVDGAPFGAAFLGVGSIVVEEDRATLRRMAGAISLADQVGVDHDCRIALAGGLSGRPGMVLITGTGSSCYGRTPDGRSWLAGGWGPVISDEGSGYWLGVQALRAAATAEDGRDPTARRLRDAVRERLELDEMRAMMHRMYVVGMSRAEIASLAGLVLEAARAGDPAALRILSAGADLLGEVVEAAARALGLADGPCELAITGGLTNAGDLYLDPLGRAIRARLPECRITAPERPPVEGACLLALALLAEPQQARINAGGDGAEPGTSPSP